jgi:hypothetical protein
VVLSLVRHQPEGHVGFCRMRNRINVMLSRARHGMVVLGHAPSLRAAAARGRGAEMWGDVLDLLEARGAVGPALQVRFFGGLLTLDAWEGAPQGLRKARLSLPPAGGRLDERKPPRLAFARRCAPAEAAALIL